MPVHKGKRARNITGKEYRALVSEAIHTPREPRIALARRLVNDIDWRGPAPAVEVIEKKITEVRKKFPANSALDTPWSAVTMFEPEYRISPATLPLVMKMWKYFQQRESRFMSIREALWTVRLSELIKNGISFKDFAAYVVDYAALEKVNEALGRNEVDERCTDSQMYRDMTGLYHDDKVENERDRHPKGEGVRWEEGGNALHPAQPENTRESKV